MNTSAVIKSLNSYNCLDLLLHASDLKLKSQEVAYKHFDTACSGRTFLLLTEQQLYEFLTGADLKEVPAIRLFHYLNEWFRHDKIKRADLMPALISKFIRTELVEGMPVTCEWNMSQRPIVKLDQVICLWTNRKVSYEIYSLKQKERLTEIRQHRPWYEIVPSALYYKNKVFLSGGVIKDSNATTNFVEYLDLETQEWYELPPTRNVKFYYTMAAVDGNLYIFGVCYTGSNDGPQSIVEKYDFCTRSWEYVTPFPNKIIILAAVTLKDLIYVSFQHDKRLHCYNPCLDKWTQTAPIGSTKADIDERIGTLNGYVYAIVELDLWLYDPEVNAWSILESVFPPEGWKFSQSNGRLIIRRYNECSSEFSEYNLQHHEWKTLDYVSDLCPDYVFMTD